MDQDQFDITSNLKNSVMPDMLLDRDSKMIKLNNDKENSPKKHEDKFSNMFMHSDSINDSDEEDKDVNRDSATFRFRNGNTRVVNDAELSESLSKSANHHFWKEIYSIHTLVRAKIGLGKKYL